MPRKKKTEENPTAPSTLVGDAVVLPKRAEKKGVYAGIARPAYEGSRRVTASIAASADSRFPKGAAAFTVWCKRQGIPVNEQRTAEQWDTLLEAFASRPIHGHRRGATGGSHKQGRR